VNLGIAAVAEEVAQKQDHAGEGARVTRAKLL
jgi:hypothetical protein